MRAHVWLVALAITSSGAMACGDDDDDDGAPIDASAGNIDGSVSTDAARIDAATADANLADANVADGMPAVDAAASDASPPQTFYWADWTSATAGAPGTASGSFAPPSGTVTVTYAGEISFAQTSGGTNYWVPGDPYINQVTANAPDHADIIGMVGNTGTTNTLTFDPPVTGLVMGLVSLGAGSSNVKYDFDTPIELLSFGAGYWGNGTIVVEPGDIISGSEGHGAIQFAGTVSTVSWTVVNAENWHGFTVGIPAQ